MNKLRTRLYLLFKFSIIKFLLNQFTFNDFVVITKIEVFDVLSFESIINHFIFKNNLICPFLEQTTFDNLKMLERNN